MTCLVQQAEHHNLPLGIIVSEDVVITKVRTVSVILTIMTKQNIQIQQALLDTEIFNTECHQVDYRVSIKMKGDDIYIIPSYDT